jgi:hypothetical protein
MAKNKKFAAFILSHGRADRVYTFNTLKRCGYTGEIVILIDNEDKTAEDYRSKYGKQVVVFDKKKTSETFDEGDNFGDRRAIIYARNACFDVARERGIDYFIQLDDDYQSFVFKQDSDDQYIEKPIRKSMDSIFSMMLEFLISSGAESVAMAQNGDFIGGKNGTKAAKLMPWRKAMNSFIFSSKSEFRFFGRINEDVNSYTCAGRRGVLFFTIPNVALIQKQTQSNAGGMTELYKDSGTFVKSFYSVMYAPSCVRVVDMGPIYRRMHHQVNWKNAVPCIVDERFKK